MIAERTEIPEVFSDREKALQVYFKAGSLVTQFGEKHGEAIRVSGKVPDELDIRGCSDFSINLSEKTGEIKIKNDLKQDEHSGVRRVTSISRDGEVRARFFTIDYITRVKVGGKFRTYSTYNSVTMSDIKDFDFEQMEQFLERSENVLQRRKDEFECVDEKHSLVHDVVFATAGRVIGHLKP